MRLNEINGLDPDRLPYFVTDSAGVRVPVMFAPLTEADQTEIEGADWFGAIYREAWIVYCEAPGTLKLVEVGATSPIFGLLRFGSVLEGDFYLRNSLLETTPALRFRPASASPLRGVGTALLARLVAESYNQGAKGALSVVARIEAYGFYERLGFVAPRLPSSVRILSVTAAESLFMKGTK